MSSANNQTNDPSTLRIRNPTECGKERREILQARVPEGWIVGRSTTTGECFYYNTLKKKSQWTFPSIAVSQAAAGTAKIHNSLSTGSNSSSNLTGGSRKYKKQRKQRKKSKTIKRRK
jgi:hypothetical protein